MKLIASGRASEIVDLGNGRVLRRFRAVRGFLSHFDRNEVVRALPEAVAGRVNVTDRERERARRLLEWAR